MHEGMSGIKACPVSYDMANNVEVWVITCVPQYLGPPTHVLNGSLGSDGANRDRFSLVIKVLSICSVS